MAQTGQYNFARALAHGEDGAAMLALDDFVRSAVETIFLLNKKHCPYYKWMFRAMKSLDKLSDLSAPLEFLLTADNDEQGKMVKKEIVEDVCLAISNELRTQDLSDAKESYLEPHGFSVQKRIKTAEIRNLHILVG